MRCMDEWMAQWSDLVVFEEVVSVIASPAAASRARWGSSRGCTSIDSTFWYSSVGREQRPD